MLIRKFAGVLLLTGSLAVAAYAQAGPNDAQIQADITKALSNSRFSSVHAQVHNGTVALSGNVALYSAKEEADKKVHHVRNVHAVENDIQVGNGTHIEDAVLAKKLAEKIAYDRVGYGTTAFNSVRIAVNNGVVTLGGTVYGPVDKDSAISDVENTPGVKDVIDNIEVAPLSDVDDRIRMAAFRAIYSAPQLNRYAIDPVKPIRIIVIRGNVTLEGAVNTDMDKQVAGMRANQVPGVFKVTNNLQVTGGK